MEKLSREDLKRLKTLCKQRDYEAVVALLDYTISEGIERLVETVGDHRFSQGAISALRGFRSDIVPLLK